MNADNTVDAEATSNDAEATSNDAEATSNDAEATSNDAEASANATAIKDTDIEKYIEKQIEMKLNSLLETLPDSMPKELKIKPIYNLTIKELYKNTLQTLIDIINEIVDVYSKKNYINNNNFIYILLNIFTKDNRKIYVGIMIVVLSFIFYVIDGVSM
jgi:hypothetical protein